MTITLDSNLIAEKNKLYTNSVWMLLADIDFGGEQVMRIVANTEDVYWNGNTYVAFPFQIDAINETKVNEVPSLQCKVCNINQAVQYYVEQAEGGIGSDVVFTVVNSANLSDTNVPSFSFEVVGCDIDNEWCTFTLGAPSPFGKPDPSNRILKNFCRYHFPNSVDSRCPYTGGTYTSCNKTLIDCQTRNGADSKHFGGFPGVNPFYG